MNHWRENQIDELNISSSFSGYLIRELKINLSNVFPVYSF